MDIRHFQRAEENRRACEEKAAALADVSNLDAAARLWSEFLVEHQRWFTRMQQAMERGPSSAWFGSLKGRRKSDSLLQYLHQARHADEHGLERITGTEPGGILIGGGPGFSHINRLEIRNGIITHLSGSQDSGRPIQVRFAEAHLRLNQVINCGVTYDPPICPARGIPYSVIRAAREGLDAMRIASEEAAKFFG